MIKYEHYPTEIEPVNIVAEYKYDIYGRRIQKNINGVITNFHWEGDNMSFELNENHQPIRRYIYENGKDDVQGYVEYAEVDDPQYFSFEHKGWYSYIKDQVGTITKVYKHETKQMINTKTYDTFGNLTNQTGSSNGNLGFQSKYFDQESGLYYFYHRYYNPQIGRFINEDPIGLQSGLNLFQFANNNPINFIDPFGLENNEFYRPSFDQYGNPIDPDDIIFPQNKIIIQVLNQLTNDLTDLELLCCISNRSGFKVTKTIIVNISISIIGEMFLHELSHIILLPSTLKDMEKIRKIVYEAYLYCKSRLSSM